MILRLLVARFWDRGMQLEHTRKRGGGSVGSIKPRLFMPNTCRYSGSGSFVGFPSTRGSAIDPSRGGRTLISCCKTRSAYNTHRFLFLLLPSFLVHKSKWGKCRLLWRKWKTCQKRAPPCLGKVTIVYDVLLRHALRAPVKCSRLR